ncbi:hypothetical protein [Paenibacillus chungangensis]|uniref:Tetratricopeptide repeat protein n=1 Tax=Paenibacillus chungangensis TaxID=696535 RepID=A0ABW3HWG1_9BACL
MIRVSVKTLVLSTLAVLLFIAGWAGYRHLPWYLYNQGDYDMLIKRFPQHSQAGMALYAYASEAYDMVGGDGRGEYVFIRPSGNSISGSGGTPEQRAKARAKLEELLATYEDSEVDKSSVQLHLAKYYFWDGEWEQAEKLLQDIKRHTEGAFLHEAEVSDYLAMLDSLHKRDGELPVLTGRIMLGEEPLADAFVVLQRADQTMGWHSPPFGRYPIAITDHNGEYRFYDIASDEYEVGVGARPHQLSGYYMKENEWKTVRIAEGQNESAELSYQFVPRVKATTPIDGQIITGDELSFRWEPYDDADYYELSITTESLTRSGTGKSSSTYPLSRELKLQHRDTEAVFSIGELRDRLGGRWMSYGQEKAEVVIGATGLLGVVYPGGEFLWSVQAYDRNGLLLSSSEGYMLDPAPAIPMFRISEDGMLRGDAYVLEGNYEEAIKAYHEEGDSFYALRALATMAEEGFIRQGTFRGAVEDSNPQEWGGEREDSQLALYYLRRIANPSEEIALWMDELHQKLKE